MMAIAIAINDSTIDSLTNCSANCHRNAPIDFLTPTSLALSAERAVDKFIKLMQAISKTIKL